MCAMKAVVAMLLLGASLAFAQHPKQGDVTMNIVLTGADTVPPEIKQAIQREIARTVTDPAQVPDEMDERIHDQFQRYGYFRALVYDPVRKERWEKGVPKEIDLTVKIDEGGRYKVGEVRFFGAEAFDPATLRKLIPMQPGEIFNVEKMRQGLKAIRELYCTKGYINLSPVPNPEVDDHHLLINVNFDIDEGAQFRIGKLILDGVEPHPGDGQKLLNAWKPHEGQVYGCGLGTEFLNLEILGKKKEPMDIMLASGELQITFNNNSHTVDFRYEFPDRK